MDVDDPNGQSRHQPLIVVIKTFRLQHRCSQMRPVIDIKGYRTKTKCGLKSRIEPTVINYDNLLLKIFVALVAEQGLEVKL